MKKNEQAFNAFVWLSLLALMQVGAASGATFTWTGSVSTDWFNTNNWSPPGVPASNDTVNFGSGTIEFTAPVTFAGQFNWSGGRLTGNALTLATNGTMDISSGSTVSLWTALTNAGTVAWMGGNLEVDYSSANNKFGLIQNLPGALWDMTNSEYSCSLYSDYPNGAYFQNAGTLLNSGGGDTSISISFSNSGTVTNAQGTLIFSGGGIIGGSFTTSADSAIDLSGAFSYIPVPTITGLGTVALTGGSLTLTNDVIPNLQLAGGTITLGSNFQGGSITNLTLLGGNLPGSNNVSGIFNTAAALSGSLTVLPGAAVNWSGGSMQGPVYVAAGALLTISSGGTKDLYGALTNAGTVVWTGGSLYVWNNSPNNQFGLIQNLPGAFWDIQNSVTLIGESSTNGAYFQNAGMLQDVGALPSYSGSTTLEIPFYNSGTVSNLNGTLSFSGGGIIGGAFTAGASAPINFSGGAFSYFPVPTITGPGDVSITGGSLVLTNDVIQNLQLAGGTITLGPAFQGGTITNLNLLAGTLPGNNIVSGIFNTGANLPGSLTVLGGSAVNWSGGSIQGPVNIAAGASLNLTSNATKYLWGALTNAGTVVWTDGNLEVDYSSENNEFGLIQNLSGALWDIQNSGNLYNYAATNGAYFQNAGTVRKSADTGATTISIPFYNLGSVMGLQGTLQFSGGGILESTFTAASGATINFNAGSFTYNTLPTIAGAGTVEISGKGTLTLTSNLIPNLQLAGGTITLSPTFQGGMITNLTVSGGAVTGNNTVNGIFNTGANLSGSLKVLSGSAVNWSGGSMQGPVNIAAGATLTLRSNTTMELWGPLTNAGTVVCTGGGGLQLDYSGANNQFGLIQNLAGGLWDIQDDGDLLASDGNGEYFQNAGIVQKSAGVSGTIIEIPFINGGTTKALQATLDFDGPVTLAGGTLVNGLGSASTYGQFFIEGSTALAGALSVIWLGGFVPALSNSFSLVNYTQGHTGTFSPLTLPSPAVWETNYSASALTVVVTDIEELVILDSPGGTNAGAVLAPLVVQLRDSLTTNAVPTSGVPVTVAIASGGGTLSGTVTRNTDATGTATFNDLSINLVGNKALVVSAPGIAPATSGLFTITPAAAAQLSILTPPAARQQDGEPFQPFPVIQVDDAFGNVVPNSTAVITAHVTSSATGILGRSTSANANGSSGSATFTNLAYSLANPVASETITIYFTSPGLAPVTNNPVLVNFIFGLITLQSGNSVLQINPTDDHGVFSWEVDGIELLYQQWFWVRLGASGPQTSLDTLSAPLGIALSPSNATINYVAAPLNVNLGFLLQGGAQGSDASGLAEVLSVQNTTNSAIALYVFQYANFDLAGFEGADTISFPTTNSVVQQGGNTTLTETVQSPPPDFWEASFYPLTLDKITGSSPATLADTITPPSAGDQTFAYEWDVTLAPGQTLTINATQSIQPVKPVVTPSIAVSISAAGTNVNVFWPINGAADYQLQSANSLEEGATWSYVTNVPAVAGQNYEIRITQMSEAEFYRLRR